MALTSEKRICTVHSPFGDDALILTALSGHEKISGLFEFDCQFSSEDPHLDFDKIVGQAICIETKMAGGEPRYFHGVVANFAQTDAEGSNVVYRAKLVPWLWFLTLRSDCRVFPQDKTALEIVSLLFEEFKLKDVETTAVKASNHPPLPFCVQYRESTFHFISRVLEHEGIHYYFRHEAKRHVLVLSDSPEPPECHGQPKASYAPSAGALATAGEITEWRFEQHLRSGRYAHTDYNFTDPSLDLSVETLTKHPVASNKVLEIYDYPGRYGALGPGKTLAELRMEAEEAATRRIDGKSHCYGFSPGFKFDLVGHYRSTFNAPYLITSVSHHFEQGVGKTGTRYENTFSCQPAAIPFRPPLVTAKPTVKGVQTAVVVGEGGKEIDIDHYGSVYVQFHWDRLHKRNPESSCRVRVGTAWAGKDWGFFCAPRIGQEVIVEFLEGDPDRPLITGLAYNAEQMPPYQGGTQSGIKTRSTPGGGPLNFNELRFEDKKGSEELFMHAEKDMNVKVKSSYSRTVGGGSSTSAGGAISNSSGADISRTADQNIVDKAKQALNVTTGKDMALRSGGSYGLTTNLGISLKAINFAAEAIESGAKAAADAVKKGAAKAGMSAASAGAQTHAAGGDTSGAAMSSLGAGLESTGSQALAALAPGIEAGVKELKGQQDAAQAAGEKLSPAVEATIAKGDALATAIAQGASPENIAAAAIAVAEGIAENIKSAQKLIEGLLPAIPSISLWAMKDVNALALWSMTLETRVKNIDIHAKNKDVNVKAKRSLNLEGETKDLNVKASKTNVNVSAKQKINVTAEEDDIVVEAKGKKVFIKSAKQIFLKCGEASISLADSGNIVINGKKVNIKGTEGAVTVSGKPIKLN